MSSLPVITTRLVVFLGLATSVALGQKPAEAEPPGALVILHTNDIHGQIQPLAVVSRPGVRRRVGGYLALEAYLHQARKATKALWLTDGGDWFQGTPEGNEDHGRAIMACRNRLEFTAVVIGNHEFDFGEKNLRALVALARHPVLGANIVTAGDRSKVRSYVDRFIVKTIDGVRVALVGLTASETPQVSTGPFGGAVFSDELASLRELWPLLQKVADEIILITHCGLAIDRKIAQAFPQIRLILGGHSHTPLPVGTQEGDTWIAQSGGKCTSISRVTLTTNKSKRRLAVQRVQLVDLQIPEAENSATVEFVEATFEHIGPKWDKPIGKITGAKDIRMRGSNQSTPAGNYVADLIRRTAKAEVGLTNKGGLRSLLSDGAVTRRQVFQLLPFDNVVCVMQMTGRQLELVLKQGLRPGHLPLEIAGARYSYDLVDGIRALQDVEVGGQRLDPAKIYRVATNSFLAGGGDGFTAFTSIRSSAVSTAALRSLMIGDIRAYGVISLSGERRIKRLE